MSPTDDGFLSSTEIYQPPFSPRSRSGSVHSETSFHGKENAPASPYMARLKLSSAMNRVTSSLAVEVVSLTEGSENVDNAKSKPKKHHMRTGIWDEGVSRAVGKGLIGLGLGRKKRSKPPSDPWRLLRIVVLMMQFTKWSTTLVTALKRAWNKRDCEWTKWKGDWIFAFVGVLGEIYSGGMVISFWVFFFS
jgi:hypothetical protein